MDNASLALHSDGKLMLYKPGRTMEEVKVPSGDGYGQELKHFVECIASNRQSRIVTPESAMDSVRLVEAEIKSAGGIDVKLKPIRPNVYQGTFNLGRMNLIYTADLGATPPTLVAQSQDGGCKWNAVKA